MKLFINGVEITGFPLDYTATPSENPPEGYIAPSVPAYSNLAAELDDGNSTQNKELIINGVSFNIAHPYKFDLASILQQFNQEHTDDEPLHWESIEPIDKSVTHLHIVYKGWYIIIGGEILWVDGMEWWVDAFQTTSLDDLCNMTYYAANGTVYLYYAALEGEDDFDIECIDDDAPKTELVVARDNDNAVFYFETEAGTKLATFDILES